MREPLPYQQAQPRSAFLPAGKGRAAWFGELAMSLGETRLKLFNLQYVQAVETDSPLSLVSGPIFKILQKAP